MPLPSRSLDNLLDVRETTHIVENVEKSEYVLRYESNLPDWDDDLRVGLGLSVIFFRCFSMFQPQKIPDSYENDNIHVPAQVLSLSLETRSGEP